MSVKIPLRSCSTAWTLSAFADEAGPSMDEQIVALTRAGLKHIDPRSVDGHNISALPLDVAESFRKKLDAAGIVVNMLGSPIGKIDIAEDFEIDLNKLRHMGRLKEILGCGAVRIFSYYNREKKSAAEWRTESLQRLRALRDLAGELGLVLYHENEGAIFGESKANNRVLADELRGTTGDGPFRLIFDFDNYNRTGEDVWQIWLAMRDATDAFHLKDSDPTGQHVPLGTGTGKVRPILADALARSWHGPLTLEPHLIHSAAVMATGPSGRSNETYKSLGPAECFRIAAEAGKGLLGELKAPVQ